MEYLTSLGRSVALFALLCVFLPACGLFGDREDPPPEEEIELTGRIVFASEATGEYQLHVMNADGTDRRPLTFSGEEGSSAVDPAWSPDGRRIAFSTFYRTDLYVMNADGSDVQRLTEGGTTESFAWSPDGKYIIASLDKELFLLDIASGIANRINPDVPDTLKLFTTAWPSAGPYLLLSTLDYPNYTLFVLDVETGQTERVPFDPEPLLGADWFTEVGG